MDLPQNFCLQSLKDALENCDDGEVDVDDGTKKASEGEEVSRLTKTTINVEKGHNDKEEEGKKTKGKRKKKLSNSALPLRKLAILGAMNHRQGY